MRCCIDCFCDEKLRAYLDVNGTKGYCKYCRKKSSRTLDVTDLADIFYPVINLYVPIENAPVDPASIDHLEWPEIGEAIQEDWDTFTHDNDDCNAIINDMFSTTRPEDRPSILSSFVYRYDKYDFSDEIENGHEDLWDRFSDKVKYRNRFFFRDSLYKELKTIMSYAAELYTEEIQKGAVYYRARLSDDNQPFDKDNMGAPPKEKVQAGRANPIGIPYLYLASIEDIAIQELKSTNGAYVAVAPFSIKKNINILDLCDLKNFISVSI